MPAGDEAVDWGKGIQWDGSTIYSSQWNSSISTWNAMGEVSITKDTLLTIEDLYIVDTSSPGIRISAGYANHTVSGNHTPYIQVNTAVMDSYTSAQRQKTLTHELGHALGINEINIAGNVMQQGKLSQTSLGTKDKEVYNCLWR
jgi:Zn-dependent peptidase ImmA (M78 family)